MRNFLLAAIAMISVGAKVAPLEPGVYAFFNQQTGQVLDIWSADKKENAVLSTSQWSQGLNQAFALQTDDNENFGVAAFHTLKGLTATDLKKDTEIVQRGFINAPSQQWRIHKNAQGLVSLQNKVTGKYITAGLKAGDKVIQSNENKQKTQLFRPFKLDHTLHTPIKDGGVYTFINKANSLSLDIAGNNNKDGSKLYTYENLNHANQQFTVIASVSSPEFVRIKAVHSGKFLTAQRNGEIVQDQQKRHGDRAQLWRFTETEDGTYIMENQAARDALTVGKKMEAAKIAKFDANNKAQQFYAMEITK